MSLMGLDVGTTGTKATVFTEEGQVLAEAYREYPMLHPRAGWVELDPEQVWDCVKEVIERTAAEASGDPVQALATSVLGEAAVPVDAAGNVLDNSILGADNRAAELFDAWVAEQESQEIMQICGQPPSQMFTVVKLMWIRENRPDLYERMASYLTFDAFTQLRMGVEPHPDYSMAARTMAFDIHQKEWSEQLCRWAGVRPEVFPPAVQTGTAVGELGGVSAEELGLPPGCLVVAGSHDQPAGALGSGVTEPGVAMDATGTVECFAVAMDTPAVNRIMLENNLACYPHAAMGLYVALAFNFTGGSLLRWVRDTLGRREVEEAQRSGRDCYELLIEQMSDQPTDLFFMPHFTMSGSPHMDPNPVGGVIGLNLATDRGQFLRAVLEGISYEMKLNLDILADAGVEVQEFRAIGGGAKSDFWLQMKADMYKRPVVRLAVSEGASLGMAIAAGLGAGVYESATEAAEQLIGREAVFTPDPEKCAHYDRRLEQYRQLYPLLKEWQREVGYRTSHAD